MRKVKYRVRGYSDLKVPFISDFVFEGVFHQWASMYVEFESGAGNYTVALVETPDGKIEEVATNDIQFLQEKQ